MSLPNVSEPVWKTSQGGRAHRRPLNAGGEPAAEALCGQAGPWLERPARHGGRCQRCERRAAQIAAYRERLNGWAP